MHESAGLKRPRLLLTERANGPTAAVGDPTAAAEAACEAPTKANVPAMEVTAVEGTGAEAATEGPTKK